MRTIAALLVLSASLLAQNTGATKIIIQGGGSGSGIQQTGGINYLPFVTSDTTTRAATVDDFTALIGDYYAKPTNVSYTLLLNKPTLFGGSYADLTNKPSLFSGSYTDLINKPALFSGDYNDLLNKPIISGGASNTITCGGTDDTAAVLAGAPVVQLPPTSTCAINALSLPAGTTLRGPGTLKWISGNTGNAINGQNANLTFDNFTLDLNGNLPASASGGMYLGGDKLTVRNVKIISTGAPAGMLNPAISIYNSGGLIQNVSVNNTVKGTHLFINPNNRSDRKVMVDGFYSDGSNRNAIAVQNSGAEGAANVEITHFQITNVTDTNGGTGQQGNAIDTYWADGVTVHDGTVSSTRFSSVRFATSHGNIAHDIKSTGTQETAYYAELGGWGNEFYNLTVENGVSGINLTNVSQRANYPNDSTNYAHDITCRNLTDYCIKSEHDIARNVLVDGVPIGVADGYGSTTGNNIIQNVTCVRTSTSYPNVDVCVAVDSGIKTTGTELLSNIATSNYTPLVGNMFGSALSSGNTITAITQGNPAVITFNSGTQPTAGSYYCLRAIGGMTQANGLCFTVSSSTATTVTTNIDSSGFSAFSAPTGGQKSWTMQFYNSSGSVQYAVPTNVLISSNGMTGVFGAALPSPPALLARAGNPYAVNVGTTAPYTTNPESVPNGAVDATALGATGTGVIDDSSALNSAMASNTVVMLPAGTYKITSSLNIPAGKTLFGVGHPTIIGNNGAFALSYINSGATLKGVTFDGGSVLNYDTLDSATIEYNTFRNQTAGLNGDGAQNNLLHIGNLTNTTIKYNTFYNDMPPSSVDINPDHGGSDPDYGSGNPKTCLWVKNYAINSNIDYNTFDLCQEGIKFSSGDTTFRAGLHIGNNLITRVHRIGIETQQYHTGAIVENNVIKNWNLHYFESYAISWATPQSLGTIVRGNFLQDPIADPSCSAGLACGLGIEFGSQNGHAYNNTIMGPWLTGSIQVFGGSTGNEVNANRACTYNTDVNRIFVSVGQDEHSTPTNSNVHDNNVVSNIANGCSTINWSSYDLSL